MSVEHGFSHDNILYIFPHSDPQIRVNVTSVDGESTVESRIPQGLNPAPLPDNFAGGVFRDIQTATSFLQTHAFSSIPTIESIGSFDYGLENRTTIICMNPNKSFSHHNHYDEPDQPPPAA